jgi:hypothetical protein
VQPVEVYFSFHPPHKRTIWGRLGHVQAFGYTLDETWFFLQPTAHRTMLFITHRHDEVEDLMAHEFAVARRIIKTSAVRENRHPPLIPLNCVSECGALVGIRAFTIRGLERKLLRNGGTVIHESARGPGAEDRDGAGAQARDHGAPQGL